MSYSPALTYFLDRLNGFSTNIFRLEPQNNTSARANQIIRFSLPSNALLNTRSFALYFKAATTGGNHARLPAKIDSLIERVEITAGGIQLSQGVHFYNVLRHAKDALYGDKCNPTLGHPDILRSNDRNAIIDSAGTITGSEDNETLLCIDYWEGFLGTCEPKILDAAILPDLVVSITLTSNTVLTDSQGTGLKGSALSGDDSLFTTNSTGTLPTYVLTDIHATIESIGLADAVYDNLVASMIAQKGFVEVPFKQFVAFDGVHDQSTRFSIATQSLDRVWMCWRNPTKSNTINAPVSVNGHYVFGGATTDGAKFTKSLYDGTQLGEKYLGHYYNFVHPGSDDGNIFDCRYQLQLNGAYYPQFQASPEEMIQISKNSIVGSSYVKNRTLGQSLGNYWVNCIRLNMPDSEFSRTISGLDTRSVSLQGYINTTHVTGSPRLTVFCECSSTLRIGAGRMLESIM